MALCGRVFNPAACQQLGSPALFLLPGLVGLEVALGRLGLGLTQKNGLGLTVSPLLVSDPRVKKGKAELPGKAQGDGSRNQAEHKLPGGYTEDTIAGLREVLNGWTFCRGILGPRSVMADRCVPLPKSLGLGHCGTWIQGLIWFWEQQNLSTYIFRGIVTFCEG